MLWWALLVVGCAGRGDEDSAGEAEGLVCSGTFELAAVYCDGERIGDEYQWIIDDHFDSLSVTLEDRGYCHATITVDTTAEDCGPVSESWSVADDGTTTVLEDPMCEVAPDCVSATDGWCAYQEWPQNDATLVRVNDVVLVESSTTLYIYDECLGETEVFLLEFRPPPRPEPTPPG